MNHYSHPSGHRLSIHSGGGTIHWEHTGPHNTGIEAGTSGMGNDTLRQHLTETHGHRASPGTFHNDPMKQAHATAQHFGYKSLAKGDTMNPFRKGEAPTTPYQYTLNHHGWSVSHVSNSGSHAYTHPDHPGHTVFASHEHGWSHSRPGVMGTGESGFASGKSAPALHEHLTAFHGVKKSMAKGASMNLFKKAGIGWQSSPLTPLQRAYTNGAVDGREMVPMMVVDESITKSDDPNRTFNVYVVKSELSAAILEALQQGAPQVRAADAALADRGVIRRSLAEYLYPSHNFARDDDGEVVDESVMVKSNEAAVRDAYGSYMARNPGANLVEAAAELDALVEQMKRSDR